VIFAGTTQVAATVGVFSLTPPRKGQKMKLKLLLGLLCVAGVAAALAVAAPTRADNGGSTTTAGSTTTSGEHKGKDEHHGVKPKCQKLSLKGTNPSGSIALTVSRASHGGSTLVGKQATLTIPAGTTLRVNACLDAAGTLTLRELHVDGKPAPATTTTTTTSSTP
jgi:hypothetical protein